MSIVEMPRQAESNDGGESADDPGPSRSSDGEGRRTKVVVEVSDPGGLVCAAERSWIEGRLGEALDHGAWGGEVRVRMTDDAGITAAHESRCGVGGTTDVITFDLSEGASVRGGGLDVDLLVCVDEARRQAEARGWGVERELLLYALHGVLHCVGYDDVDEVSSRRMHAREDEILAAIGVGRTFDVGPGSDGVGRDGG